MSENQCLRWKELQHAALLCLLAAPNSWGKDLACTPMCVPQSPLEGAQAGTGHFGGPGTAGGSEGEAYLPSRANTVLTIRFICYRVLVTLGIMCASREGISFIFICAAVVGYIEVSDFCMYISSSGADEQRIGGVFFGWWFFLFFY